MMANLHGGGLEPLTCAVHRVAICNIIGQWAKSDSLGAWKSLAQFRSRASE